MNTLHLKYALEIEKTGSISQAAQNRFVAQPNLSKAIKDLEKAGLVRKEYAYRKNGSCTSNRYFLA